MKILFSLFTGLFLITAILLNTSVFAYQLNADISSKRLPKGTKMNVVMSEAVVTNQIQVGDLFSARLTSDIKQDGRTVLPQGTLVRGTVKDYTTTARLSKSAVLYLTFDHIVTPQGKQIPINAAICSGFDLKQDGAISGGGNYFDELKRNVSKSGYIISKTTKWGITSGDELFNGGRFLVTPIAAIGGTVGGVVYLVGDSIIDLFRRGNDVIVDQGKSFDIILLEPLDIPLM